MLRPSVIRLMKLRPMMALVAGTVAFSLASVSAAHAGPAAGKSSPSARPIVQPVNPPEVICILGVVGGNGGCVPLPHDGKPPSIIVGCEIGIGCTVTPVNE